MSQPGPKRLAFDQLALTARALGNGHRLELLDILVQGERSVERLAQMAGLSVTNTSHHLHQLRRAGLLTSRKVGTQVIYALADPEILTLVRTLVRVAKSNLAELERVIRRYYSDRDSLEPVSRDELLKRLRRRSVVVLDVRPADEYAAAHIPSAVSIPVSELKRRLREIPRHETIVACCRGPFCVYSYEAIEILRPRGFKVRRLDGGFSEWLAAGLPVVRAAANDSGGSKHAAQIVAGGVHDRRASTSTPRRRDHGVRRAPLRDH